jgi:hypothetical protein
MLKPRSSKASFYGSYLYDKIVPAGHLLRKACPLTFSRQGINQVVGLISGTEQVLIGNLNLNLKTTILDSPDLIGGMTDHM